MTNLRHIQDYLDSDMRKEAGVQMMSGEIFEDWVIFLSILPHFLRIIK